MRRIKVTVVMGTRPEVIKMAPVIQRLSSDYDNFRLKVCVTAQHRQLLDTMLRVFGIKPQFDLDVMRPGQSLNGVLIRVVAGIDSLLRRHPPDLLLVQGDTTTVLATALSGFHRHVPVGHIEAGLRSFNLADPFPEEMNRIQVDHLAALHFAPTRSAARNLRREGVRANSVFVTGNTSIDALHWMARSAPQFERQDLRDLPIGSPVALVTLHRRESFGATLRGIVAALERAAAALPEMVWVYPVHPNPEVRRAAASLQKHPRFRLLDPVAYPDFVRLMRRATVIVTDSGGVQEEAPSFGTPVLVVRETTERTELLGRNGKLVGTDPETLFQALLGIASKKSHSLRSARNPFGDGKAAQRIRGAILHWAGRGRRPRDFADS